MKLLKKSLIGLLAVGCVSAALGFAACGGGGDNSNTPTQIDYTVELSVQGGAPIAGVDITLTQDETEIATGKTDENGKFSGTAVEGDYVVELGFLPEEYGYLWSYTVDVSISEEDSVIEIGVGSKEFPRMLVVDDSGEMEISLPAKTTHHYVVPRPMGRPLVVESEDIEIVYNGVFYTPQNGKITVPFASDPGDTYAVEKVSIVNKAEETKDLTVYLYEEPGSEMKPIEVKNLDETLTATVKKDNGVYYTWTATGTGTVTVSSDSVGNQLHMYNNSTYLTDENANSISLAVNEGDVISIRIDVSASVEAEETEVQFTVSFVENTEE